MSDPFAEAQVPAARTATAPASTAAADPFQPAHDSDDPFATSSDFRGDFSPSPTMDALKGRLCVMIPRSFDPTAKNPLQEGETRECYTVDLYVLTGGRMSWFYTEKGNAERGTVDEVKEYVVEEVSPETPYTSTGFWVPQGTIIGKLKKMHANGALYIGVPVMGPAKVDRDKGKTVAQVEAEVAAWIQRGRAGARPRYSWSMADPTPEQRQIGVNWWKANRTGIAPVNTSTAPAARS